MRPDELRQFIDAQVSEQGYGSSGEYLRELIRKQRDVEKLRNVLLEGFNSGPVNPVQPRCQQGHASFDAR